MSLKDYFENKKGLGVLSTADDNGVVNSAVYSRPHVMEDETIAFIMRDRRSHKNIVQNPYATYLFKEDENGFKGKRLYIKKVREEKDSPLIADLERRKYPKKQGEEESKFLVFFKVDKELPLIGDQVKPQ